MSRLVIISNRVASADKPASGGLAVAMEELLQRTGGIWFGWSGDIVENETLSSDRIHVNQDGLITRITIDLTQQQYDSYYHGFSNDILWPVFHNRIDLANFNNFSFEGYQYVNKMFALTIKKFLKEDDVIWVHDYHLIPLASGLRDLHCNQRIGFFLHIPLPPPVILETIPQHKVLINNLAVYDLIGFQTSQDVEHFSNYLKRNEKIPNQYFSKKISYKEFPIGIDTKNFIEFSSTNIAKEACLKVQQEYSQRRLIIGVDRIDYSKGLIHRIQALRELFHIFPENRKSATLIQVGSPTRETNATYINVREEFETLCGAVNGDYGELDWMPVRYLHQTLSRENLAGLYRAASVGMVTPLKDGMNLVAKEYIAAQDAKDPGVLILSQFAGAAEQMQEALIVNPYDIESTAKALQTALKMSLCERIERHQSLLQVISEKNVHWWSNEFLAVLTAKKPLTAQQPQKLIESLSARADIS